MGLDIASVLNASHIAWLQGFTSGLTVGLIGAIVLGFLGWLVYEKFFKR